MIVEYYREQKKRQDDGVPALAFFEKNGSPSTGEHLVVLAVLTQGLTYSYESHLLAGLIIQINEGTKFLKPEMQSLLERISEHCKSEGALKMAS